MGARNSGTGLQSWAVVRKSRSCVSPAWQAGLGREKQLCQLSQTLRRGRGGGGKWGPVLVPHSRRTP